MKLYRCGVLDYPDGQIYSIDVHPSGKYVATCGSNGKGDGLVTIWDTSCFESSIFQDPAASTSSESLKFKIVEKRLFHNGQNCVRWSKFNDGKWLVSAGDSATLHLYEPFCKINDKDVSLDKVLSLNGHTMEILHAEFSKDGRFLASCSLDMSVIIWNLDELPKPSVILDLSRDGHCGFVTGLAFDPVEKFLATQSADNTLKIWRCDTWECEKTIQGVFISASRSSLYTRLDWSSDGSILIATCGINSGFNTAKLILRNGFDYERDLVGFKSMVSCVRSNDRCVSYEASETGKKKTLNLVAVGSIDRSVSIWMLPEINRPLCVIRNLSPEGIMDLSWHGNLLVAIGISGSVRCIIFDESEIGKFLSGTEMCEHFDSLYKGVPSSFKSYLPTLSGDGNADWIERVKRDLFIPKEHLTDRSFTNHKCLGFHQLDPRCDNCLKLYSATSMPFNASNLSRFANDLSSNFQTKSSPIRIKRKPLPPLSPSKSVEPKRIRPLDKVDEIVDSNSDPFNDLLKSTPDSLLVARVEKDLEKTGYIRECYDFKRKIRAIVTEYEDFMLNVLNK